MQPHTLNDSNSVPDTIRPFWSRLSMLLRGFGLCCLCMLLPSLVHAQATVGLSRRAVDMVALEKGPTLYGAIVERARNGDTRVMVSRDWLKAIHPEMYAMRVQAEAKQGDQARAVLLQRLESWIQERSQPNAKDYDKQLVSSLKIQQKQLARPLQQNPANRSEVQFFEFRIPGRNVRRVFHQPLPRRRIAAWAWHERLKKVELRSAKDLQRELSAQGIQNSGKLPSLAARLPVGRETETQWAIRQALFEYQFRKPLDFQGTDQFLIPANDGLQNVDIAGLFQNQMQSPLSGLFTELSGGQPLKKNKSGLQRAQDMATQQDTRGFRATTTRQDLARGTAVVTTTFYARVADDRWVRVFSASRTGQASQAGQQGDQLKANPQIAQILQAARQFGATDNMLQQALSFGAVTQAAQQQVDGEFRQWLDPYLRQLDRPAIEVAAEKSPQP